MDAGLRAYQHFMESGPGLWVWLMALVLAGPVTFLHELGHATAARRRLTGTVRVEVGAGDPRWQFAAGGIEFSISPFTTPIGHAGSCIYDGLPTARDALAIALAGPAATAFGLVVSLLALPHTAGAMRGLVWTAAMMQGFSLVLNLVPFRLDSRLVSDGRAALDALRAAGPPARPRVSYATSTWSAPRIDIPPPQFVASPLCATCGHPRDEHVDLATGLRGPCAGQDFDFQNLAAQCCGCVSYTHAASSS